MRSGRSLFVAVALSASNQSIDRVYTELFSALEQTDCAVVSRVNLNDSTHSADKCRRGRCISHCDSWTFWWFGYMAGTTWNCCRLGACSVYTIQPRTSLQSHFTDPESWQHICYWRRRRRSPPWASVLVKQDPNRYKVKKNAIYY